MINRSILAAIIAIGSFSAAHAAGAADWQTFPGQCNFAAEPKADNRPLTGALPVLDSVPLYVRVHLAEKGVPHIALWTDRFQMDLKPIRLQPGSLLISVAGRAFSPLHTAFRSERQHCRQRAAARDPRRDARRTDRAHRVSGRHG